MSSPLRMGVLGAANIVRQFAAGVSGSPDIVLAAVASRTVEKAENFAREIGVARAHGTYEALLADPGIDAVYVPLPNSMHSEWAIKAAAAKKHVLCEKPLAMNAVEARAMFAAADTHGVFLREAYPWMAQTQTGIMRGWLNEGAIGRLRLIRSSFGFFFDSPGNIRLTPEMGGGALYDAGSYAVSLVRIAAGEAPVRVHAVAELDAQGVDRTTAASLTFASGLIAQISCSFSTGNHRHAMICGEDGVIETNYLNHPPLAGPAVLQIRRGPPQPPKPWEIAAVPDGNGFRLEAESFARLVRGDAQGWSGATPQESIDIARTLDAIRKSMRSGQSADVDK